MPPTRPLSRSRTALIIVALLCVAAAASAASLAITRASWSRNKLYLSGTAPGGSAGTIANAASGLVIGTAKVEDSGRWKAVFEKLAPVPCRVRVIQGTADVERAVSGAPSSCDSGTTKSLTSLAITGPATVPESSTAAYAATASFSDGSTQNVTATAAWSESSSFASISGGVLTTGAVSGDQPLTVSGAYTSGGVTRTASVPVTIQNAPTVSGSHAGRFTAFEGTKTCLTCHPTQAAAFHASVHYQWSGDASDAEGLNSPTAGKMGGINDFCIYPDINWLGQLKTVDGALVDGGCARCHTGLGAKPSPDASQDQLENIDCLICHAPSYKRTLQQVGNDFRFVPDTAKMSVSLLQAAVDLRLPGKDACLNCHTKAGGGDNFKRGDISEAHRNATTALDVHMAPSSQGGAGLECTGCHTTTAHRMAGRGVDMRQRDSDALLGCSTCHSNLPHDDPRLNRHTTRVACNVCHVPAFAKGAPTDMRRDWSLPGEVSNVTRLVEPHMAMQSNVTPVYRFFNGRSRFYQFGSEAVPQTNGMVLTAGPLGSRTEPGAKITAMKRHTGRQPIDPKTQYLLPLKIGIFFQTGDLATAVAQGTALVGWANNGYEFAETERFMGLYHEVAPASQALTCSSCHGGSRLDFAALGYTPRTTLDGKPLCASCHGAKNGSFTFIHDKHVTDKRIDCISCHTFSKG
ncbi:MAG TPA: multiheme c-type cytochrome [Vicinamibacterales bacterium]|nr:multiheme c-type cytochrome [Vicinamibacterales bacterium]